MEPLIRKVTENDREVWLEFRQALWPDSPRAGLISEMDRLLQGEVATVSDPDYGAVVLLREEAYLAFVDSQPLGLLELSVRDQAPGSDGKPIAFVEGWYIAPEFRKQGYGGLLMRFALDWAKNLGFDKLASDTTSNFPGSYEAHIALGFREIKRVHHFCMDCP
jgi:aminoglycoside 6'-N-acetyltransferase I